MNRFLLTVFVAIKDDQRPSVPEGFHPDLDSKQSEPGGRLSANLARNSVDYGLSSIFLVRCPTNDTLNESLKKGKEERRLFQQKMRDKLHLLSADRFHFSQHESFESLD